MLVAR
jgi:hypothetical protein